jgi:alkaline phosphatase D
VKPYYRPALFLLLISLSNASYSDPYKIAFGSCLDQDIPQPIWSTIQKDEVNAFIFLGDNVYGDDDSSGELDTLRAAYSKQRSKLPSWLSEKEIYSIWDDHEFTTDGVKVHLIALDTRYFRSELDGGFRSYKINDDDGATILGNDQWSWLNKVIKKDADLIILMTSIQLLATNHAYEKWSLFPNERKKMLKLIDTLDTTTIVLSGDRHRAGIYKHNDIYEITASALNRPSSRKSSNETDPLLLHKMYVKENYGLMLIDGINKEVKFSLKDIKGNLINTKTIQIKQKI